MPEYYSSDKIRSKNMTFNFIIGGRGIGKTFDLLLRVMKDDIFHLYLRRTQIEVDLSVNKDINPYLTPGSHIGKSYEIVPSKNIAYIKDDDAVKGFAVALSTFSNVRGGDFREVKEIIFDEFIPEKSKRSTIKDESGSFFNLYESVNRNREMEGQPPVKVFFLSNAVSIVSDMLIELGLVENLEMMIRKSQRFFTDPDRSIAIELPDMESFKGEKEKTALYRLTKGTRFYDHALNNKFAYDSWYNIAKKNIAEYVPLCGVLSIFIFRHKSNGRLYATFTRADCVKYSEDEILLFRRNHYFEVREKMIAGKMDFSCMTVKKIIEGLVK